MSNSLWMPRAKDVLSTLKVELSPEQARAFYTPSRIVILAGGEGAGKSFLAGLYGGCRSLHDAYESGLSEDLLYWVVGEDFEDARMEFDYVREFYDNLDPGLIDPTRSSEPTLRADQKAFLRLPELKITWETVSAYDASKIGRKQPSGVLGAEISRWKSPEIFDRCYGRLQRLLGWGWFSGSYESSEGPFAELVELGEGPNDRDILSTSLPTWANLTLYPGGYNDPKVQQLRAASSLGYFMERYGGRAAPPQDAVLPEFKSILHVTLRADYDDEFPVYLFVDPGTKVYCVLFVQFVDDEVHIVDELYTSRQNHQVMVEACQVKAAWANIGTKGHVIDAAGAANPMSLGTPVDVWKDITGIDFTWNKTKEIDELDKLRSVLAINPVTGRPRLQIHPRCRGIISEMGGGMSPVGGQGRWRMINGAPQKHDNNHGCKALSYGLLAHFGVKRPGGRRLDEMGQPVAYNYMSGSGRQPSGSYTRRAFGG